MDKRLGGGAHPGRGVGRPGRREAPALRPGRGPARAPSPDPPDITNLNLTSPSPAFSGPRAKCKLRQSPPLQQKAQAVLQVTGTGQGRCWDTLHTQKLQISYLRGTPGLESPKGIL